MRSPTEFSVEMLSIKLRRVVASPGRAELKIHQIIKLNKTINIWLKILQILKSLKSMKVSSSNRQEAKYKTKTQLIRPKYNRNIVAWGWFVCDANQNGNFKFRSTQSVKTFASHKQHSNLPFQTRHLNQPRLSYAWWKVSQWEIERKMRRAIAIQPLQSLHALPFVLAFLVCIKWISYWHTL